MPAKPRPSELTSRRIGNLSVLVPPPRPPAAALQQCLKTIEQEWQLPFLLNGLQALLQCRSRGPRWRHQHGQVADAAAGELRGAGFGGHPGPAVLVAAAGCG
ncbi:MAG: hypothetical protein ACKOPS_20910 [Cyanobium sp.]